jgi:hypothetical protein
MTKATKKPKKSSVGSNNPVDHPAHYTSHPSGIEAIEVCGEMGFCLGNAFKYLFRFENKSSPLEDLRKAIWYIKRKLFLLGVDSERDKSRPNWNLTKSYLDKCVSWDSGETGPKIAKIVGKTPGNVEKAILAVFVVDRWSTSSEISLLRSAIFYIEKEIAKLKEAGCE